MVELIIAWMVPEKMASAVMSARGDGGRVARVARVARETQETVGAKDGAKAETVAKAGTGREASDLTY